MQMTPLFAALLAIMFVVLSVRVVRLRRRLKVSLGDGGERELLRAIRVHSNFAEYVPMGLVLLYLVEQQRMSSFLVFGLGAMLLLGRLAHAYGLSQEKINFRFRVGGMALTFGMLALAALTLLGNWFYALLA
jgi:uncharacterized protein